MIASLGESLACENKAPWQTQEEKLPYGSDEGTRHG
jgi:hypothetical protein